MIDLPDPILREAKLQAVRRGVTLKAFIQQAVEKELKAEENSGYRVRHPLVKGNPRHPINLTIAEIEDLLT